MKMIMKPSFEYEKIHWNNAINIVIGIDEVGRGAFAGPIVAAAVVFSSSVDERLLKDINDSKLLKFNQRENCAEIIKREALYWSVAEVGIDYINKHGIGKSNSSVFRKLLNKVLEELKPSSYSILIDGFHKKYLPGGIKKQQGIIKGDQKSFSIAAASIIAKVYRDRLMIKASQKFPNYRFSSNKGYGTKGHQDALKLHGLTEIHRKSFNLEKFLVNV
jgi:ribonuclease HII